LGGGEGGRHRKRGKRRKGWSGRDQPPLCKFLDTPLPLGTPVVVVKGAKRLALIQGAAKSIPLRFFAV